MLSSLLVSLLLTQPPALPLQVASVKPRPDRSAWFVRTSGWTGSDCAYSIRLSPNRTLWLFGDTWIGEVKNGRRVESRMINNSAAWQDLNDHSLRFFWDDRAADPAALLRPADKDHWYWPGDGALVDGSLYLIGHVMRHKEEGAPGFQFDWVADDLIKIGNPNDPPLRWNIEHRRLPSDLNLGVACCVEGDYLYVYGLLTGKKKPLESPLGLARIHRERLAKLDPDGWEVWTGQRWQPGLKGAAPLIRDGASEMSVQKLRGIDGYIMVYMPAGHQPGNRHPPRQASRRPLEQTANGLSLPQGGQGCLHVLR